MEPELIADYACETGEGPLWHPFERRLYWLDISNGRMFRYDPATNTHEQFYQDEVVAGMTIQADGALLLFMERGAIKLWRNGEMTTLVEEIAEERGSRFNDVIADPRGRVFCGTMPSAGHLGALYRLDTDGTLTRVLPGIDVSNGMAFMRDRKQMYYTESSRYVIYVFDYDEDTGALTHQRVFKHTPLAEGFPDGMTIDGEGYIWSARWDGGCLIRYAPDGSEERRVNFPAKKVSSVTFGGDDYQEMYVTTAGGNNKAENGPGAGALFRLRLGIRGVPEFFSKIKIDAK